MKLTSNQIKFLNQEIDINNAVIQSRPSEGILTHLARREALRIIVQLQKIKD